MSRQSCTFERSYIIVDKCGDFFFRNYALTITRASRHDVIVAIFLLSIL